MARLLATRSHFSLSSLQQAVEKEASGQSRLSCFSVAPMVHSLLSGPGRLGYFKFVTVSPSAAVSAGVLLHCPASICCAPGGGPVLSQDRGGHGPAGLEVMALGARGAWAVGCLPVALPSSP